MPTTDIDQRVKRIADLDNAQVTLLRDDGITTEDDLRFISFVDINQTIPIVKRRKLDLICKYLANGDILTATTTIESVQASVRTSQNPPQQQAAAANAQVAAVNNVDKYAPKVHTNPLPKFSGDPVDYEDWERRSGATIRQTAYKHYLTRAATVGDPAEEARSSELYYMLQSCVGEGHALNTVEKSKDSNNGVACGYLAWKALNDWYMDPSQTSTMVAHYEGKLDDLLLDNDSTATEFINSFELFIRKLEKLEGPWSDDKRCREFKDRVSENSDYDTEIRTHVGIYDDLIKAIRKREQALEKKSSSAKRKARRYMVRSKTPDENDDQDPDSESEKKRVKPGSKLVPFLPNFLYKSLKKSSDRKNIAKWRSLVNAGKQMVADDLASDDDEGKKSGSNNTPPTKDREFKKKWQGGKKQRRTKIATSGIPDDTVTVKITSEDESYIGLFEGTVDQTFGPGYDSDALPLLDLSINDVEGIIRRTTSVGMSRGRPSRQPYAVIDPGAEEELIGGDGWHIVYVSGQTTSLSGAIEGMGSITLPKIDAITSVKDKDGNTILLGVGNATFDRRPSQYESLWNSHHLREHGTIVDDVAKSHGGQQCLKVKEPDGNIRLIPLEFDGDIMKVDLFTPTEEELATLRVTWITPTINGNIHTPQSIRRNRVAAVSFQLQRPGDQQPVAAEETLVQQSPQTGGSGSKNWKELLGFPSKEVLEKTLKATTQLCAEPVEMERREMPKQHRKKRLLPLHPRRLRGRVDSDTFFSTVKSIRSYKCVQFFVHVNSDYLFVRCMQREAHSHGAYQDFVREVGAPQVIITDNSQTQTGQKWEATSRSIITKQRKFAPHNQNQSKAERRIQDVKHKTVHVLQRAKAPLEFWCYALIFIVDCINHLAKKRLGWRTSQEVMNGDTADISAFRFTFWQEIEYYEPSAKFPQNRWQNGRFIGIAWDSGDQFTFYVWTEPDDGGWNKGQELTRNLIRPRRKKLGDIQEETKEPEIEDMTHFKFQKKVRTKKRRGRKREVVYTLQDLVDEAGSDEDGNEGEGVAVDERTAGSTQQSEDLISEGEEEPTIAGGEEQQTEQNTSHQHTNTQSKISNDSPKSDSNPDLINDIAIDSVNEVNEHFSNLEEPPDIGGSRIQEIIGHEWRLGHPAFKVKWSGGNETSWETLLDMRQDYPSMTAQYIVSNKVSRSNRGGDRVLRWAKQVVKDMEKATRRIARLYDFFLDEDDNIKYIRRTQKNGSRKKKRPPSKTTYKYGVKVPRNVDEAIRFDNENGDTFWQDAMRLEVGALVDLDCFEFKSKGWKPEDPGFQKTTLHMVFDVKHDLRRKARLVAGGHLVNVVEPVYSSTVKSISVQLLHVIAHKAGLRQLCGDIGNAFPNAYTNEKVYIPAAGPEFGDFEGCAILIHKAIYGLASSSERFHTHLADALRSFGWSQTRFDNDVWIRLDESGKMYEYLCTHVDDFMIASKKPEIAMEEIQSVYLVKDSSKGPPDYYLGNDYKQDKQGRWCIGCKKYLTEAILRIEKMFGELPKKATPMEDGDHPEEDDSEVLGDSDHQKYQMLMGMLNWVICLGRIDVAFAGSSLGRFSACPRKGHLERVLRVFGYLKKNKNRRIVIDSRDPIITGGKDSLEKDFTEIFREAYPDAAEEIDAKIPVPLIDELEVTTFVDSDHAHDRVTRRSITGILILVGRTPVFFSSKRQGAIETSTYGAEFCAMRTAVEEVQSVRYMLRCLGVKVRHASLICGDNMGVIQNSTIAESLLKKKHVAIAFHKTRESAAAGICHPIKTKSKDNFADILTKAVTGKTFWSLYGALTRG